MKRILRFIKSIVFKVRKVPNEISHNQDLGIYFNESFANILETWGEDHVWNEIQLLLANSHGKVLDIACGTGIVIKKLESNKNIEVWGFDISDLLINRAIQKGIDPLKLKVMDATKTDYPDLFFDYSYSIGSLEHFSEDGIIQFINESYRYTKYASFHKIPVSRSGMDEGWIKTIQTYFNNSEKWWEGKFRTSYSKVLIINSGWKDDISIGKWFICYK